MEYDILLNGLMIMVYQRDTYGSGHIINDSMVLKGNWKLSIEEHHEDFIYKKTGNPS